MYEEIEQLQYARLPAARLGRIENEPRCDIERLLIGVRVRSP